MASNGSISNGTEPTIFTLHVTNLPLNLEKDAVTNIFLDYGQVTGCIIIKDKNNTNQAYISYSKYVEAECAINDLHETLPLMLNIQFKDKNLKNYHKTDEINLSYPVTDFRYRNSFLDNAQGMKKMIDIGKTNCTPTLRPDKYTSEDDLLYTVPDDLVTFNPYESAGPYGDTNLMYTRGVALVSKDGRTRICFGRGCTYYNLPEPHYNIESYLQNVCERRENGIYEFASDNPEDDIGNCKICSTPTAFRCQKCGITFYCNKTCQINDWPKHKLDCSPVPPLIKKKVNEEEPKIKKFPPLRRPKIQQEQQLETLCVSQESATHQKQCSSVSQETVKHQKQQSPVLQETTAQQKQRSAVPTQQKADSTGVRSPTRSTKSNISPGTDENRNELNKKTSLAGNFKAEATSFRTKKQSPQQNRTANLSKTASATFEDNIVFQSNLFLSKDKFIDVSITSRVKEGVYWVQKPNDSDKITKLCEDLGKYVKTARSIDPAENIKCVLDCEAMYYRVTIQVIEDNKMQVFYNDFGTVDVTPLRKVWSLNGFENQPYYARCIHVVDTIDFDIKEFQDDMISVKAVKVDSDGTINVQAKAVEKKKSEPEVVVSDQIRQSLTPKDSDALAKLLGLPNVLDTIKVGQSGLVVINAELSHDEFSISLVPQKYMDEFQRLLEELKVVCSAEAEKNPHYSPNIGDLICGESVDGEWFRGIVFSIRPVIKMALIDECKFMVPVKCTPLPSDYNCCSMGLVCKYLPETQQPAAKFESAAFTVEEVSNNTIMIILEADSIQFTGKALVKKWIPKAEQKGIEWSKLTSRNEVVLTVFSSQNLIYARSLEPNEAERTHRLEQEIAKAALNRKPLTKVPVVGQIVMAQFLIDENYYRAIVIKVEGKDIIVKYVDYGNEEVTTMKNLYELPEELKECPSAVTKISLKGVDKDIPLTKDALCYIQELIAGVTLKCTFTGHPFEDGVVLTTSENENVNEKLKNLLKPTWEKEKIFEEERKVYLLNELPPLKLGDVGDEIQAIVLAYYKENGSLILGPNDIVAVEAIQIEMTKSIAKYVEKNTSHYIPRDNELCIAKYENDYYRGVCLETSCSPIESRIFFVDFGNTERVKHTDIRVITSDFMNLGAYATLCNITPMVPNDKFTEKVTNRISDLAPVNEPIIVKIISYEEDGSPNIDVPAIRIKLIEEKLI